MPGSGGKAVPETFSFAEVGHMALILAFFVALVQSVVPLLGASRRDPVMALAARPGAVLLFILVVTAFGCLLQAFVVSDFSVALVARNSHSDKPLLYRISGTWGNHEGSLLLWILILAVFSFAVAVSGRGLPLFFRARVLAVQSMISSGFLAFILFTSNPFARLDPAPLNGQGLNPLLQDPGLAFHPPMLYLGYVGFSMAFSFAVAALIEGRVDAAWARWVRPWTLAAWVALTLGIGLGSWWAYYELGWGGWWFWDPVENASLMPWLLGTALVHTALVVEKRDTLKSWTILLSILTFGSSLLGTFLVRSGVLTSVHAFASDPQRGLFVLLLLGGAVGGALVLYTLRAPALKGGSLFSPVSRESGLLLNNLFMSTIMGTVLVGTLYPLLADALDLGKVSVGAPFFNATVLPLMVPVLLAMAVGPLLSWKRADLVGVLARLRFAAVLALVAAGLTWLVGGGTTNDLLAAVGFGLALWLGLGTLTEWAERVRLFRVAPAETLRRIAGLPGSAWGMTLAHLGMAVLTAGVTASSVYRSEAIQNQAIGEAVHLNGWSFTLNGVDAVTGPNYESLAGSFVIRKGDAEIAQTRPEKRHYRSPPMPTTEAGIHTTGLTDLYTVLGDPVPGKSGVFVTRIYVEPLVPCLWYGALLMGLGGLISLMDRRLRIGAPARRAKGVADAGRVVRV
ncbi:heme lyase CcmF/NrfE family subunit [Haematospirillum jordaniae]|uniref:heme lyase CcmF/NrfE family subunit n=1 Tax=Haematospirillum jordaniae TaxID=1549855 RepID=UPI001432FD34|nr:heme lyase CcmF/NrfE family subunit [Haematospirillum jordaniae]NKD44662.1 heme lyase CcmF/NrfE family subunit [Haematospirillum jordaniae]NKD92655.1 heme lyase CcmF/NrfE family subunit [Haematospirillum jordaniae]